MKELSLAENGHAWRMCGICKTLRDGHDYDTAEVRGLFDSAKAWAREKKIRFDAKADHAKAYLDSIDKPGIEPVIPEHVKLYCAEMGAVVLASKPAVADVQAVVEEKAITPPPGWKPCPSGRLPSIAMRQ